MNKMRYLKKVSIIRSLKSLKVAKNGKQPILRSTFKYPTKLGMNNKKGFSISLTNASSKSSLIAVKFNMVSKTFYHNK